MTDAPETSASKPSSATGPQSSEPPNNRMAVIAGVVALLVAAAVFVIVVAVNKHHHDGASTTEPPTTNTTLSPQQQKVLNDYRSFWNAYFAAANPMRPDDPILQQHATGDELKQLVEGFSSAKLDNVVFKGTVDLQPRIVQLAGDQAVISDCLFDHSGVYDATTGERKDVEDSQRQLNTVNLKLIDGTWKVTSLAKEHDGCSAQ